MTEITSNTDLLINFTYVLSAALFIFGLKLLGHPNSARKGNALSAVAMLLAIVITLLDQQIISYQLILFSMLAGTVVGIFAARLIAMTAMPELVSLLNGIGGLASLFVAWATVEGNSQLSVFILIVTFLALLIGGVTFSGSLVAWAKLSERISGRAMTFSGQVLFNILLVLGIVFIGYLFVAQPSSALTFEQVLYIAMALALLLGIMLVLPIGGADMPVVISMLNSYSGWAAAGIGFTLENSALIITGALVGSSGAILSYIMCKGMNRSFFNVILGGFGATEQSASTGNKEQRPVKSGNAEDAAFLMKNASSVIIVPGYGMAVAQAQHALREMVDTLKKNDIKVTYAIHPVAGRMPGHMNVLLAEANVPYDEVFELEEINNDFANADVAFVIGANDVTNPVAKTDPQSPIYGMPVLDVEKCKSVLFVKRSLSPGYAGIDNELFYKDNTLMLFADAKKMTEDITKNL